MRCALLAVVVGVALGAWTGVATAGLYHLYSCRTPAGLAAPTDGWQSNTGGGAVVVSDTCFTDGSLTIEIPSETSQAVGVSAGTWIYTAPPQTTMAAATVWRSGTATNVLGSPDSTVFWLSAPKPAYDANDTFDRCVPQECTSLGDLTQPLAAANEVPVPPANIEGATQLEAAAACLGDTGACPASAQPAAPSGSIYVWAADITLDDQSVPLVTAVSGGLSSDTPLTGPEPLTFSAADAGPGLYQVIFQVDGKTVETVPVDNNGGHCVPASPAPSDGTNAFLYGQPCVASANPTETFDTTQVPNGMHELLVQVTDASGAATTVLDRKVLFQNGAAPGGTGGVSGATSAPNGTNASASAALRVRWGHSKSADLTSNWGQARRIVGTLTSSTGQPISGAVVGVRAMASYAGASPTSLGSVMTDAHGAFASTVPGNATSRTLTFAYDAHIGDSQPAATASLTLLVHAGISMSVRPHMTAVGRVITFRGVVRGGPIPLGGKQLVLEARAPGSAWIEFQVIRTNGRGRFTARYRFRFAGPASYQFRAVSEYEADFPFLGGASNVVGVFER